MSSLPEWSWSIINGSPSISVITRLSFNFRFLVSTSAATWRSKDSPFLYPSLWSHLPLLIVFCFYTFCPFCFLNYFPQLLPKFPFLHSHLNSFILSFYPLTYFLPITPHFFPYLVHTSFPFLTSANASLSFL